MHKPKILILAGDGINCERETALAFQLAQAETQTLHINDLLARPTLFHDFQALALPGGFSFGDDLGSGQVLGLKLGRGLSQELRIFVAAGKPVIGICNGFQALAKLGLLPMPFERRVMAIGPNSQGHFVDRWVDLEVDPKSACIWTQGLADAEELSMPIRHGEGRVVFVTDEEEIVHNQLTRDGQIPLRYRQNVNGSYGRIAGVSDPRGLVFGLMPHPEAAISLLQHPRSSSFPKRSEKGVGLRLFENCVKHLREA